MYQDDLAHIHHEGFTGVAAHYAPELLRLMRRLGIRPGDRRSPVIVEVGCGSGVLAARFVDAGFTVVGIDRSPAMIRIARRVAPGARFRVARLERARLPRAHAVVAIGEIVTYVPGGLPALQRFFARVRRALKPGGLFVFDFIESAAQRTYRRKVVEGPDWTIDLSAWTDRSGRVLTRRMKLTRHVARRVRRSIESHRVRIYSREEIGRALSAAGFEYEMRRSLGRYRLYVGDVAAIAR